VRGKLRKPSPALVVSCIALFVALGPVAYAANTVFSTDIVDGEIKTADLGDSAVTSVKVLDDSITGADLKGADIGTAKIKLAAGAVPNGRCKTRTIVVAGAKSGEAVTVSLKGKAPNGMLFYGERVPANNRVLLKVCNLTGGRSPKISNVPIRVFTFG
jgi:hypothetical protein